MLLVEVQVLFCLFYHRIPYFNIKKNFTAITWQRRSTDRFSDFFPVALKKKLFNPFVMKRYYHLFVQKTSALKNLPLLLMRLVLAYGFYHPAIMKWKNINGIIQWFDGMGMPFPALNAYLAATTEAAGVVLLTLGLGVRFISIPLMITMLVAIKTVHWGNGFEAGNNGFEIPLYYLLMLFTLMVYGGGKWSVDYVLSRKIQ